MLCTRRLQSGALRAGKDGGGWGGEMHVSLDGWQKPESVGNLLCKIVNLSTVLKLLICRQS